MLDLENPEDGDEGHAVDAHFLQQEPLQDKGEPDIGSPYEVGLTNISHRRDVRIQRNTVHKPRFVELWCVGAWTVRIGGQRPQFGCPG
jgi:hypothetical protein